METKDAQLLIQRMWSTKFTQIDHWLLHKIGLRETFVLKHLVDLQKNFFPDNKFFQQMERISKETTLSEKELRGVIKRLHELNLIIIVRGYNAMNYYSINYPALVELYMADDQVSETFESPLEGTSKVTKRDLIHYTKEQHTNNTSNTGNDTNTTKVKRVRKPKAESTEPVEPIDLTVEDEKLKLYWNIAGKWPKPKQGNKKLVESLFLKLSSDDAQLACDNLTDFLILFDGREQFMPMLWNYVEKEAYRRENWKFYKSVDKPNNGPAPVGYKEQQDFNW
jgi:DNA-binding Lrp family transcriptional regulator